MQTEMNRSYVTLLMEVLDSVHDGIHVTTPLNTRHRHHAIKITHAVRYDNAKFTDPMLFGRVDSTYVLLCKT
jgi:hypothetical protein